MLDARGHRPGRLPGPGAGPVPVTSYATPVPSAEVTKGVRGAAVTVVLQLFLVGNFHPASSSSVEFRHARQVLLGPPLQHRALPSFLVRAAASVNAWLPRRAARPVRAGRRARSAPAASRRARPRPARPARRAPRPGRTPARARPPGSPRRPVPARRSARTSYRAAIRRQSVSSARSARACWAAIEACRKYFPTGFPRAASSSACCRAASPRRISSWSHRVRSCASSRTGAPCSSSRAAIREPWISSSACSPSTSGSSGASAASIRASRIASFARSGRIQSSPAVAV